MSTHFIFYQAKILAAYANTFRRLSEPTIEYSRTMNWMQIARFPERLKVLFHNRGNRPVLLGHIAEWVGCSLEVAQRELEPLLLSGEVVKLTPEECKMHGLREESEAFVKP